MKRRSKNKKCCQHVFNSTIDTVKKQELLSTSTAKKLAANDVRTLQIYVLPKIPKTNIPGRPVVSLVECHEDQFQV